MKTLLKKYQNLFLILLLVFLSGFAGYKFGTNQVKISWKNYKPGFSVVNQLPSSPKPADFSLFWQVWDTLSQKYVDKSKLDAQKMVFGAIQGMVAAVGDPYTVFLPPKQNMAAKDNLNGSFEGIGAELGVKEGKTVVVAPLSDSPAATAGIQTGDWIIKVNGEDISSLSLPEVVDKIRGPKGTQVTLTVLHPKADKPTDILITRNTIILNSVQWHRVGNSIDLQLMRFGDQTKPQWDRSVEEISKLVATQSGQISGLVLDLRNNPGGYLDEAVYIASEFLPSGTIVVKQQDYQNKIITYSVNRQGKLLNVPLVVLINGGSASASEILAGSLQVAGRAKLIGDRSFGKGSVQEAADLPDGAGLHVTIAKWLLANDVWINGKGLTPDIKIENDPNDPTKDLQLNKAIETLSNMKLANK